MPVKKKADSAAVDKLFIDYVHNIVPVDLEQEMRKSFIDYAMSVITDRALPDVRDGLKPVHRRILYSMYDQGFTPDKAYRKCATTVGDVIGRFHPHGDAAVYDAQVRLAQDFSMREMLVDGHGNFGSRDGDAPAAYRYTEARLTRIAMEMMGDINKDTVDFRPNYDEHELEPEVLPARFPNLLVNGSTGIAVGMATNIPPHNLNETIDAVICRMEKPGAELDELMAHLPGPDFPTGGTILGTMGIRQAYQTGRGRIVVRALAEIEELAGGRHKIVVRDLPYQVNKARLIERIDELVKQKKLDGISFVRDESDRNEAVRIVIELKRDANPNVVLNRLYKHTQMQEAFSANMLALIPDEQGLLVPKLVSLTEALDHYIAHQKTVVLRRTRFELDKAETRKHLIEGLRIAIDYIDEVISIIRASRTEDEAKRRLQERFSFSERQAQHIVDMRLGRLTGLEREKLDREFEELLARIAGLKEIIEQESRLIEVIREELEQIKKRYGNPRRTRIEQIMEEISDESLIAEETVVLTKTRFGYVKRLPLSTYESQHRGGRGISGMQTREEDFVDTLLSSSTHATVLFFTTRGRVFRLKAYQIPEGGRQAKGMAIVNLLQLEAEERVQAMLAVQDFTADQDLVMATAQGLVKRTSLQAFANINRAGLLALNLREGDRLVGVCCARPQDDLLLVTAGGMSIRFALEDARRVGRSAMGVRGINLRDGDRVVGLQVVDEQKQLVLVTAGGLGKALRFPEFRRQKRGGYGLRCYPGLDRLGPVVGVAQVEEKEDIILINDAGLVIRIAAEELPSYSRYARGVRLMRSQAGQVVDIAVVEQDEEAEKSHIIEEELSPEELEAEAQAASEELLDTGAHVEAGADEAEDLEESRRQAGLDALLERAEEDARSRGED